MTEEQFNAAMERIRAKDKSGLKDIYESYIGFIYHVVLDIVKSKETAEDITSEFFIKLWEKADSYRPGSGHKGYIATIARNMAIDYLRKSGHEIAVYDDTENNDFENQTTLAESTEEEVVANVSIEQALDRLKPIYRQIVTMKVLGDMTFKEIATALSMPIGTVTWNYQDAIKQLRRFGYE